VKHVAVVPVAGLDGSTRRALRYASTLTPRVVAVHLADGTTEGLVDTWAEDVPLVLLDAGSDWQALLNAIQVLRTTEQAERVTVVVPPGPSSDDLAHLVGPGVVLCSVPSTVMGL
jgi:hypothetical protein